MLYNLGMAPLDEVLNVTEAAEALKISRTTLWRYVKEGRIPVIRYSSKKVLIRRAEIERFIKNSEK